MKISVITATWNCNELLGTCLTSFAKQSYANKEHIVIDGASTDGTISLIQEYIKQIAVFISEPDLGIYDALNKGIQASSGDVIGFLHSDDLYNSEEVLGFIAKAFADPSVCAVFGDLEYVMRHDINHVVRRWRGNAFKMSNLSYGWMPAHPTFYVRRDWYIKIGGFDTSFKISADYHSILKFFLHPEFKAAYIPRVLIKMRMGGTSNKSLRALIFKSYEDWRVLRSCGFSVVFAGRAIFWKNVSKIKQFID